MYKIIKDGALVGITTAPTYIKMQENGCYGLCSAVEATGVVVGGAPYALRELDDLPVAEVKEISDVEFMNYVMRANAALKTLGVETEE